MILLDGVKVKFGNFPNGERNLNFNTIMFTSMSVLTLKYETDQDLFDLFILKKFIDERMGYNKLKLDILYMPYSRMDRRNQFYTFNLKYVCDFINSMNFYEISVIDAHSDVTLALLNNAYSVSSISRLWAELHCKVYEANPQTNTDFVIMYPDAGAEKRYSKDFAYPSVIGVKERDFKDGRIIKFDCYGADVQGKDVIIIDDLCSKGGTFVGAAKMLKERGAKDIFLIVSHCEETIFEGEVFSCGNIAAVFTTNSILYNKPYECPLHIIPIYTEKKNAY